MKATTACAARPCRPPALPTDASAAARIEEVYRAFFEAHATVPEMEVHSTEELTWMSGPGVSWSNAAVRVRLRGQDADAKLRAAISRAFTRGRGFGMWVSELAEPADLGARLTRLRFRKRKRFPGMLADLSQNRPPASLPGIAIDAVEDAALFVRHPHPYFGRISTDLTRFEMRRVAHLVQKRPQRVFHLVAMERRVPIASATLFVDGTTAAFFDVGVREAVRGRGVGTHLMQAACAFAAERGARAAVLLSSGMGYGVYARAGFRDVCRIAYWYSKGDCRD